MQTTEEPVSPNSLLLDPHSPAYWRRKLFWIALIGFALRISFVAVTTHRGMDVMHGSFGYGAEMGRIAQSLAEGHGFSSPFREPTGPTAWEPPAYPFLLSLLFRLFGVYTRMSAFVALTINCAFSSLTAIVLFYLARRSFGWKIAHWCAWTWALFPYAMYWAVKSMWETSITAFLLTTLVLIALRLAEGRRAGEWALFGFLWGIGALVNPSILSLLPFVGLWAVWELARQNKPFFRKAALAAVVYWACITPWLVRSYRTFGQPVFLRTNFGAELRMGNGPSANGMWLSYLHPTQNVLEFARYKHMGEIAYVKVRKREAVSWIKANPGQFAKVTVARIVFYWTGAPWGSLIMPPKNWLFLASSIMAFWGLFLMWRQRRRGYLLYAAAMIIYPLVYYVVFPHPRYRAPIEPLMGILIVFLISQTSTVKRQHRELG
jgi:4-amino-4-deoxy-L-arabinose transferase-like glycosyltransferase